MLVVWRWSWRLAWDTQGITSTVSPASPANWTLYMCMSADPLGFSEHFCFYQIGPTIISKLFRMKFYLWVSISLTSTSMLRMSVKALSFPLITKLSASFMSWPISNLVPLLSWTKPKVHEQMHIQSCLIFKPTVPLPMQSTFLLTASISCSVRLMLQDLSLCQPDTAWA